MTNTVIKCKAKDLMRELAIIQLRETRIDDINRIKALLKTINCKKGGFRR